jgi:hypothetical protein
MEGGGVVGRRDGDGLDAEFAAGPEDVERDLPVRYEPFDRHGGTLVAYGRSPQAWFGGGCSLQAC